MKFSMTGHNNKNVTYYNTGDYLIEVTAWEYLTVLSNSQYLWQ